MILQKMTNPESRTVETGFISQGIKCAGTLYLPDESIKKPAVIVLAHGFGAEKSMKLSAYAQRFNEAGFAAYLFDYRCFGESEGQPRHWVSPKRHLADWRAAIHHVQMLENIDAKKMILWGTSLAGGHVLQIASENPPIAAVISQIPHVDGMATVAQSGTWDLVKACVSGLRDVLGSAIVGKPYYSKIVGRVGEFAAINSAGSWEGYHALLQDGSAWKNRVLSRVFLEMSSYSPIKSVHTIQVPVLVVAAENDTVTPFKPAQKAADKITDAEFHSLKCGHFDPYAGEMFEENIKFQLNFLQKHFDR